MIREVRKIKGNALSKAVGKEANVVAVDVEESKGVKLLHVPR